MYVGGVSNAQLAFAVALSGAIPGAAPNGATKVHPCADLDWYPEIPLQSLPRLKPLPWKNALTRKSQDQHR